MKNIELGTYPFLLKTIDLTKSLRSTSQEEVKEPVAEYIPEIRDIEYDLLVNLVITGDYVTTANRSTYGAWLSNRQYDSVIGFIRRTLIDLAQYYSGKIAVFVDPAIVPVVADIVNQYQNLIILTNNDKWSYRLEILMFKLADVLISRATNYVPNIAMVGNGALIYSPCPADGYMDEDTAAIQASELNLGVNIPYDADNYIDQVFDFIGDKDKVKSISRQLIDASEKLISTSNSVDLVLQALSMGK